jgi:hypothetical protein
MRSERNTTARLGKRQDVLFSRSELVHFPRHPFHAAGGARGKIGHEVSS